jgi:GNAT superfamily N-acetyltransferase
MSFSTRSATRDDVPLILAFIRELAEYENLTHMVVADETLLDGALFGVRPVAEVLIAQDGDVPVGFALFFHNFSTFLGRPGLYLEDLFIRPAHRGKGFGKAMMIRLAQLALERDCGRFEWSVLDWNAPSIAFYRSLGAVGMDEWKLQRVAGPALTALAGHQGSNESRQVDGLRPSP